MNRRTALYVAALVLLSVAVFAAAAAKGPWIDKFIQVGDIKIHYLEAGGGDRTLVFIPGWIVPADVWREQLPYFSVRGFRVLAMDPRSQGQTTKTEVGNTYQQHAADLYAFLQALKIESSYLVAWSAGTLTLLEYLSSPETLRPEKVVFVESSPFFARQDDYPGSTTPQQARKLLLSFQDDRIKATDQYIRSLFRVNPGEILIKELSEGSRKSPLSAAATLYFDQYSGDRRPALRHVDVPALIVTTQENRAIGEYMQARIPRSTLEVLEGAGSCLFLDKPQAFNQALDTFFGEH
jgi:microsomal epoxide hydrolase